MIIEDRTRLERVCDVRLTRWRLVALGVAAVVVCALTGMTLTGLTPLRRVLPGHLDADERALTETHAMRLDTLSRRLEAQSLYIDHLRAILGGKPLPQPERKPLEQLPDPSELEASKAEKQFAERFAERERYNLAALPGDASTAMFAPPASDCLVRPAEPGSPYVARIVMPAGAPVGAPADGRVVAAFFDPSAGWAVVMQHSRGYVSRYSRLGHPLVAAGDPVGSGQVIALTSEGQGRDGSRIEFELWQDGDPVRPHRYIAAE